MRIATSTLTNITTGGMGNAYGNYANIINKIISNKNFTKMSENVPDATKVLKLNDQLAKLNEYQSNIQAATDEMNMAYDVLGEASDEVSQINSLIVEAANVTTTPEGARAIAQSIKEKVGTITDKMNQKYLDNYLFSGTYTQERTYVDEPVLNDDGTPKLDEEGNPITQTVYKGSPKSGGDRNVTISEDTKFSYNLTAQEIFGSSDEADSFFSKMQELDELLTTEPLDYDAIRSMIKVTEKTAQNITEAQGKISSKVTKLDTTKNINTSTILNLTEQKVDLEEVDIVKAASDLASAQTALQASYLVGTQVLQGVSLLDYL